MKEITFGTIGRVMGKSVLLNQMGSETLDLLNNFLKARVKASEKPFCLIITL